MPLLSGEKQCFPGETDMLKNLILDMGGVLIRFDPPHFLREFGLTDEEDIAFLDETITNSAEWRLTDQGYLTEKEMGERLLQKVPDRLKPAAEMLIYRWPAEPIPGMEDFVRESKAMGLSVYMLSNVSLRVKEYWNRIPGHALFDGSVISAEVHLLKPEPEIYRHLLMKYSLSAEESLFVDDTMRNVLGAEAVGIHGFHFTGNVQEIRNIRDQMMKKAAES